MKYRLFLIMLVVVISTQSSTSKELKQKRGFKVPDNTALVTTLDVNLDKTKDYIVQSPEQITIYNGKDNALLYSVQLDARSDESFLIDLNTGKFARPDLVKDLNGNGIVDIPIRGLSSTGGEYLKIIDPNTGELMLDTRFAPNSDNLFIYDVDGNDTLDVIIERLDSVLIFSSTVIIPSSINFVSQQSTLTNLQCYPNPTVEKSTIIWNHLGTQKNEYAFATIVDVNGHEIRRLKTDVKEYQAIFEWDGKRSDNNNVSTGVYFVKVISGEHSNNTTIVVAH